MGAWDILPMKKEHTPILADLESLCFSQPWSREALEAEIGSPNAVFFVALGHDGALGGYAGMHCAAGECYLDNIAVFPEYRRRGAATSLLSALEAEARRRGGEFLSLEVRPSNTGAVRLYTRLGFREEGRRKGFYTAPPEDALILTKRFGEIL